MVGWTLLCGWSTVLLVLLSARQTAGQEHRVGDATADSGGLETTADILWFSVSLAAWV